MVDPQSDFVSQICKSQGQHTCRSGIHADNGSIFSYGICGQTGHYRGIFCSNFRVLQHKGGFAQLPQTTAKGSSRTQCIAIRLPVGQDIKVVLIPEEGGALSYCQLLHQTLPQES